MFTIKWITCDGTEHVWSAAGIRYQPGDNRTSDTVKAQVQFRDLEADTGCSIDSGRVFVMNAAGKTVADYVLTTDEFPHGVAASLPRAA